ncbi:expressed unknown protein [Seminavis robusta]|uniref:Uncharacterized protein n=1 Tax=Seminavis robusta TaxID=568900 RepID=A0A9N8DFP7_9STRA|nr:expressed unknown protein [Seminavis robusta]|eukprot:Sro121_g059010.1 n/a (120) ;mRNA; f:94017-94376
MDFPGQDRAWMPMGNNQAVPLSKLLCAAYWPRPASVGGNVPVVAPHGMPHGFMLSLQNALHDAMNAAHIEGDGAVDAADMLLEPAGTANERTPVSPLDVSDSGDQTVAQLKSTGGSAKM